MGRLSSIYRLPPDAREALDGWLRDPAVTQEEATARVNTVLAESHPSHPPVSKSSVNRYSISTRWLGRWRTDTRVVAAQAGPGTADAAGEAGRTMGRLVARLLPARVRMHFVAEMSAELARAINPGRQRKGRK